MKRARGRYWRPIRVDVVCVDRMPAPTRIDAATGYAIWEELNLGAFERPPTILINAVDSRLVRPR